MARYTKVYSAFLSRIDEIERLIRFASAKERINPITLRHEINALCRGAVVLLSSHLEGYVRELGELALESLYDKQISRSNISSKLFFHISKSFFKIFKTSQIKKKWPTGFFHSLTMIYRTGLGLEPFRFQYQSNVSIRDFRIQHFPRFVLTLVVLDI